MDAYAMLHQALVNYVRVEGQELDEDAFDKALERFIEDVDAAIERINHP